METRHPSLRRRDPVDPGALGDPAARPPRIGIGVDGCRGGWLAIRIQERGWDGRVFGSATELHRSWGGQDVLTLIDIPIGLPESTSFRPCDAAARRYLGRRSTTVFNPPTRAALAGASYAEAADLNQEACGKRLSKQTWFLVARIAEVDRLLRGTPGLGERWREAHPEVLFQALNHHRPLDHGKKAPEGLRERLAILRRYAEGVGEIVESLKTRIPRRDASPDDILDALAAAVVAFRFADSLATLPERPGRDAGGLRCEMVLPRIPGERVAGGQQEGHDAPTQTASGFPSSPAS